MIAFIIAIQVMQAPTVTRPAVVQPKVVVATPAVRKHRMIADGRALVARAEQLSGNYSPAPGQPTKAEIDALKDQVKSDLDSMSEMGEMESLRLQMAMDRLSKFMSTLSNMLKKASETQSTITSNIK